MGLSGKWGEGVKAVCEGEASRRVGGGRWGEYDYQRIHVWNGQRTNKTHIKHKNE